MLSQHGRAVLGPPGTFILAVHAVSGAAHGTLFFQIGIEDNIDWQPSSPVPPTPDGHPSSVSATNAAGTIRCTAAFPSDVVSPGEQTGVRFTPTLTFMPDALPESARHIDDLLAVAAAADAQVEATRRAARPAGEADPYRKPRVADDDAE